MVVNKGWADRGQGMVVNKGWAEKRQGLVVKKGGLTRAGIGFEPRLG